MWNSRILVQVSTEKSADSKVSTEKSADNKLQLPLAQTHKHPFHKSTLIHCSLCETPQNHNPAE